MGMFDRYIPDPPLSCPLDRKPLGIDDEGEPWQGKSGPCLLQVYRQGSDRASSPAVTWDEPDEVWHDIAGELPDRFELHKVCSDDHMVTAEGRLVDGVWAETELLYVADWGPSDPAKGLRWGQRPSVPLWPYDTCDQLFLSLGDLPGVRLVQFLRENRGLRVVLDGRATEETRAAIPTTYFGHPVEVESDTDRG